MTDSDNDNPVSAPLDVEVKEEPESEEGKVLTKKYSQPESEEGKVLTKKYSQTCFGDHLYEPITCII
jgi:hypothetical protein